MMLGCSSFIHLKADEVADEAYSPHHPSSPTGRSYSPSRKMNTIAIGETLPDTVRVHIPCSSGHDYLSEHEVH